MDRRMGDYPRIASSARTCTAWVAAPRRHSRAWPGSIPAGCWAPHQRRTLRRPGRRFRPRRPVPPVVEFMSPYGHWSLPTMFQPDRQGPSHFSSAATRPLVCGRRFAMGPLRLPAPHGPHGQSRHQPLLAIHGRVDPVDYIGPHETLALAIDDTGGHDRSMSISTRRGESRPMTAIPRKKKTKKKKKKIPSARAGAARGQTSRCIYLSFDGRARPARSSRPHRRQLIDCASSTGPCTAHASAPALIEDQRGAHRRSGRAGTSYGVLARRRDPAPLLARARSARAARYGLRRARHLEGARKPLRSPVPRRSPPALRTMRPGFGRATDWRRSCVCRACSRAATERHRHRAGRPRRPRPVGTRSRRSRTRRGDRYARRAGVVGRIGARRGRAGRDRPPIVVLVMTAKTDADIDRGAGRRM